MSLAKTPREYPYVDESVDNGSPVIESPITVEMVIGYIGKGSGFASPLHVLADVAATHALEHPEPDARTYRADGFTLTIALPE